MEPGDSSSLDTSTDDLLIDTNSPSHTSGAQPKSRPPLCGYLAMPSKTGLMRAYKSKWFIYSDESGKLLYYKNKGELVPEGEIVITHATFTFDAKLKPGVFEIRIGDSTVELEASGREEMFTWLQELQARRKDVVKQHRATARAQVEQIITSSEKTDRTMGRQSTDEEFVKVEADEIPRIVYTGGGKADHAHSSAAMNKLSHNVSKAADSAKEKLTSLFNRKSNPIDMCTSCESCRMMEGQVQLSREDARMAREELSANQHVLKMLHNKMDLLLQEIHTLENTKKIYEDPNTAMGVEREKEHQKLLHMVSEIKKENEKLASHNKDLLKEVDGLKERQTMCQETIQAKDAVIVSLSDQLDKLTTGTSVGDPSDPPTNLINLEESFHESVKDKLEAFELQNKFLNKEILELHFVRLEDEKQQQELNLKYVELEARNYQLHSKYLLVLNEMNKPQIDEKGEVQSPDDLMSKLLEEAMTGQGQSDLQQLSASSSAVELRESLNSSFRAAKKYDSYGFEIEGWSDDVLIQAANLQTKSEQVLSSLHESPEAMSMRVKWQNFLAVISSQEISRSIEFKNLIRGGIPKDHRERVWNILINFHVGKFRTTVGPQYYEKLQKKHSRTRHNPMAKQIELDLRRTLPNNKYFEEETSEGIPKLRRILLAYSYHNPVIGYCQGMNRVAAFALLFLKEEDAFWCLVCIIDFIMPQDYFSISMVAAQADQRVLRDILVEKCPRVTSHLDALEMDISLFSFNWFLTLFIENIPIPTVLRIWDAFLFEGIKILFRYATAFFKYSEEGILRSTDYITANQYLREMGTRMIDTERITYIAFNSVNPFPMRMIQSKRAMYLEQVKTELRELNALREEFRNQRAHLDYQSDEEGDDFDD